jgi:hypothetical protein
MIRYLKFIALVILIALFTPTHYITRYLSTSPKSIFIESMDHWQGTTIGLQWLDPDSYGSTGDGPSPVQRLGAAIEDARLYPYELDYSLPADGLELLDGWRVMPNRLKDCTQYEIRLKNVNGKEALFTTVMKRGESYISHNFLACIGGSATAYYVVVVNAKYLAFRTSEPGWVFFDRVGGKFLDIIATESGNCGYGSNLLRTTSGQMLIEYVHANHCGVKPGLYVFGDPAPVVANDMSQVLALNRTNYCRIEKLHDRICKPGGKYGDTGRSVKGSDEEDKTQGLKGSDTDNNGIRDDIDQLIAKKYSAAPEMKRAVEQSAKAVQRFMEATTTPKALIASVEVNRASACVTKTVLNSPILTSEEQLLQIGNSLRALTRNTPERSRKYENSNSLVSGTVFDVPKEPVCD